MLAFYIAGGIILAAIAIWLFKFAVGAAVSIETGGRLLLKSELKKSGVNTALIPDAAIDEIVAYAANAAKWEVAAGAGPTLLKGAQAQKVEESAKVVGVEIAKNQAGQPPMTEIGRILIRYGVLKGEAASSTAKQDALAVEMIAMGKRLGAKSAREAAEMVQGRPLSDTEWQNVRASWDRNW